MARYQHTQVGWWLIVLLGGLAALMLGVSLNAAVADPNATAALRGVTVFIVLLAATFGSLTVHVGDGGVVVRFGPGPISRAIPLDAIESVRTVRNRWWHGWGVRYVWGSGWMFNVSGLDAVELVLRTGKRFRIGTDEPRALAAAIEEALPTRAGSEHEKARTS